MIVVKTIQEAKDAAQGKNSVYFTLQKKTSNTFIHQGHDTSLQAGRVFGSFIIVGFWYPSAVFNYLYPELVERGELEWDRDGCIEWAESKNIDVLLLPEYQDEINIFNISNLEYYKDLVERIWKNEKYAEVFTHSVYNQRAKMRCFSRLIGKTGWKYIFSWKDGITRFVEMDFAHKHTNSRFIITDAVKSPDGIFYSSTYFKYSDLEKIEVAKIEPIIRASNLSGPDPVGVVADNIRAAISSNIGFFIRGLNVVKNDKLLGPGRKIVDIKFSVGQNENIKHDNFAVLIE